MVGERSFWPRDSWKDTKARIQSALQPYTHHLISLGCSCLLYKLEIVSAFSIALGRYKVETEIDVTSLENIKPLSNVIYE